MTRVIAPLRRNAHNILPPAIGAGAGGVYAERKNSRGKRIAEAGAAGAAGYGAFKATGLAVQHRGQQLERVNLPGQSNQKRKDSYKAHLKSHGLHPNQPGLREAIEANPQVMRTYPRDLAASKYKRILGQMSGGRGKAMEAGAVALPALMVLRRDVGKRSAQANLMRWGVGALGYGGVGGAAAYGATGDKEQTAAGLAGAGAAQGLYQGASYGTTHRLKRLAKDPDATIPHHKTGEPVKRTRSQVDHHLRPVKEAHGAGTPAFHRNYPKALPEWKAHRVLGWTHRGKTGNALGAATTLLGGEAALRATRDKKVSKSREYGYRERTLSPVRTVEGAAGASLLAWGGSRLPLSGAAAWGQRVAAKHGGGKEAAHAIELARALGARTRDITGRGAQSAKGIRQVAAAVELVPTPLRPAVATTVGALLAVHAHPLHNERFVADRSNR